MYLGLTIFTAHIASCFCFVGYEMFPGFEPKIKLQNAKLKHNTAKSEHDPHSIKPDKMSKFSKEKLTSDVDIFISIENTDTEAPNKILKNDGSSTAHNNSIESSNGTTDEWHTTSSPIKLPKFHCFENEKPVNIGTYEVPSERDLVQLIQNNLVRMFNTYQQKALYFLKDIQEATKATADIENKCRSRGRDHVGYKRCVRQISSRCEVITKNLITSLQKQRADVSSFVEGTICNVTEMKADPIVMIKSLAMEDATLEFALPSFLRLLGACSYHCESEKKLQTKQRTKPPRHLSDQEVVIRHLLSKKHPIYRMLGKDSKWIQINK